MKRVIIVGAGGMGREVADYLDALPANGAEWCLAGFLDGNPSALDGFDMDLPILGDPRDFYPRPGDLLVSGLGLPGPKRAVVEMLLARGAEFLTLIHPTAVVSPHCELGEGAVVCPRVVVSPGARVGRFVLLNIAATVCHDARVGDFSTVCCHADITGGARLGEDVFLGSHASVLPGLRVEAGAVVGAGAVVTHAVPAGATVAGAPARRIERKARADA